MATNLAIDDKLLNRAVKIGALKTKKETVTIALQEFIGRREQRKILESMGTFQFHKNWNHKKDREYRR